MQTTYRLKAHEISMTFLKSLKTLFAGQEVEITIKPVGPAGVQPATNPNQKIAEMLFESRANAPVITPDTDIRALIDQSQHPGY
jgi:hypothetical protein